MNRTVQWHSEDRAKENHELDHDSSRKHAYIIFTPLNPTFM